MAKRDPKTPAKKRGRPKKAADETLVIKPVRIEELESAGAEEEKPFPKADVTVTRRDY